MSKGYRGFNRFIQNVDSLDVKISKQFEVALNEVSNELKRQARRRAPVRTGLLRKRTLKRKISSTEFNVYADTYYAKFVISGTRRQAPNPYIYRALVESKHIFHRIFDEAFASINRNLKR